MDQDRLTRLQRLQTEQCVPAGEGSAGKSAGLQGIKILRCLNQSRLVEDTILAQCTINHASEASLSCVGSQVAVLVALVEQGGHLVAFFELRYFGSDFNNLTGAVGTRNNWESEGEGILSLRAICQPADANRPVVNQSICTLGMIRSRKLSDAAWNLTRTSFSPTLGMGASPKDMPSKPLSLPDTIHCFIVVGAMARSSVDAGVKIDWNQPRLLEEGLYLLGCFVSSVFA